jgi:hypothetical protein
VSAGFKLPIIGLHENPLFLSFCIQMEEWTDEYCEASRHTFAALSDTTKSI